MIPSSVRFLGVLAVAAAAPLRAAESSSPELDEVIVTASLAEARLGDLPASVTVLRSNELGAAGRVHFGDVLGAVPNLGFAGGTSRPRYFQIRGIGELEQYEGAPNPSVGFLIDDIDFSGIAMPAALFDPGQAEVLRGPQGTIYGANAIAGLISLRSAVPQQGFEARGELEAGNYDSWSAGLVLNDSISAGNTAWRLALHRDSSDGFRRNDFLRRSDTNGFDENLARLRVSSQLTGALAMNLTLLYSDVDNGYDAWSLDNSRITLSDQPGKDAQQTAAAALRLDYDGWDGLALRSITTFADADMEYAFDGDWGNDEYWGVNGPYDFFESIDRHRQNITQELRLRGGEAQPTSWVVGAYGLRMEEDYDFLDLYNGDVSRELQSSYRAVNLAVYGQVDHALSQSLSLSAGLRLERRDAHYDDSNGLGRDPVDNMVGGHLSLNWKFADNRSAYLALTRGYKAGGINTTSAPLPEELRAFDPEYAWNLETGLVTRSADGRFDSRTSLFYMRRYDQQVSSSVQTDPQNPLDFVLLTDNAAKGENYGVEASLGWRPVRALRLGATLGLLQARFIDYTLDGRDLGGRDAPHAPNYQLGLSAEWRSTRGWFAQVDGQAVDGFYFSASHDERAPAYRLVNLRLGYGRDRWQVTAFARNLFDEQYAVRGFFFANEPPDWEAKRYVQNGDPRTWGARLEVRF